MRSGAETSDVHVGRRHAGSLWVQDNGVGFGRDIGQYGEVVMAITTSDILRNGLWLTLPPLLLSLGLMLIVPTALTPAQFNAGIPTAVVKGELVGRIIVFAMPAFFSVGLATKSQQWGLGLYLTGVVAYFLSYGTQNLFPDSAWSTSLIGFTASAYTNVFWMIGLGLLGEKFYFGARSLYRPVFYIAPAVGFVAVHVFHAVLYHQRRL